MRAKNNRKKPGKPRKCEVSPSNKKKTKFIVQFVASRRRCKTTPSVKRVMRILSSTRKYCVIPEWKRRSILPHKSLNPADADSHGNEENVKPADADSHGNEENVKPAAADSHGNEENVKPAAADSHGNEENVKPAVADSHGNEEDVKPAAADSHGNEENVKPDVADSHGSEENVNPDDADSHGNEENVNPDVADSHGNEENVKPAAADSHGNEENVKPAAADSHSNEENGKPAAADSHGNEENVNPDADTHGNEENVNPDADTHGNEENVNPDADTHGNEENDITCTGSKFSGVSMAINITIPKRQRKLRGPNFLKSLGIDSSLTFKQILDSIKQEDTLLSFTKDVNDATPLDTTAATTGEGEPTNILESQKIRRRRTTDKDKDVSEPIPAGKKPKTPASSKKRGRKRKADNEDLMLQQMMKCRKMLQSSCSDSQRHIAQLLSQEIEKKKNSKLTPTPSEESHEQNLIEPAIEPDQTAELQSDDHRINSPVQEDFSESQVLEIEATFFVQTAKEGGQEMRGGALFPQEMLYSGIKLGVKDVTEENSGCRGLNVAPDENKCEALATLPRVSPILSPQHTQPEQHSSDSNHMAQESPSPDLHSTLPEPSSPNNIQSLPNDTNPEPNSPIQHHAQSQPHFIVSDTIQTEPNYTVLNRAQSEYYCSPSHDTQETPDTAVLESTEPQSCLQDQPERKLNVCIPQDNPTEPHSSVPDHIDRELHSTVHQERQTEPQFSSPHHSETKTSSSESEHHSACSSPEVKKQRKSCRKSKVIYNLRSKDLESNTSKTIATSRLMSTKELLMKYCNYEPRVCLKKLEYDPSFITKKTELQCLPQHINASDTNTRCLPVTVSVLDLPHGQDVIEVAKKPGDCQEGIVVESKNLKGYVNSSKRACIARDMEDSVCKQGEEERLGDNTQGELDKGISEREMDAENSHKDTNDVNSVKDAEERLGDNTQGELDKGMCEREMDAENSHKDTSDLNSVKDAENDQGGIKEKISEKTCAENYDKVAIGNVSKEGTGITGFHMAESAESTQEGTGTEGYQMMMVGAEDDQEGMGSEGSEVVVSIANSPERTSGEEHPIVVVGDDRNQGETGAMVSESGEFQLMVVGAENSLGGIGAESEVYDENINCLAPSLYSDENSYFDINCITLSCTQNYRFTSYDSSYTEDPIPDKTLVSDDAEALVVSVRAPSGEPLCTNDTKQSDSLELDKEKDSSEALEGERKDTGCPLANWNTLLCQSEYADVYVPSFNSQTGNENVVTQYLHYMPDEAQHLEDLEMHLEKAAKAWAVQSGSEAPCVAFKDTTVDAKSQAQESLEGQDDSRQGTESPAHPASTSFESPVDAITISFESLKDTTTAFVSLKDTTTTFELPVDTITTPFASPIDVATSFESPVDTTKFIESPVDPASTSPESPVDPASTSPESPVDPASTSLESPVDPASTSPESPMDPASTSLESPVDPASTSLESPMDPASTSLESPVDPASTAPESPVDPASTSLESPVDPASTSPESPMDPASTSLESPVDPASTSLESPVDPASTSLESPVDPASTSPESPMDPASTSLESPVDPASTSLESPMDPASTSLESPVDPASTLPESPMDPASTSRESPMDPASTSLESPVDPASTSPESLMDPASTSLESPVDPASTSLESPVDPVSTSLESPVDPASTSLESPVDPASTSLESPVDPASTSPESPVDPASTSLESPVDPASTQLESSLDSATFLESSVYSDSTSLESPVNYASTEIESSLDSSTFLESSVDSATFESSVDSDSTSLESPVNHALTQLESPVNHASTQFESPVDPASKSLESPVDPASTQLESPVSPKSFESPVDPKSIESPMDPASTQIESPVDPKSLESPVDPASTQMESLVDPPKSLESPVDLPSKSLESPVNLAFTSPESPVNPASTSPESPVNPVSTSPESPVDPASTSPESPVNPASTSPESPVTPASTSPVDPVDPAFTSPESPVNPVSTSPESPVDPASTSPESPVDPDSKSPESPVDPDSTYLESPADPSCPLHQALSGVTRAPNVMEAGKWSAEGDAESAASDGEEGISLYGGNSLVGSEAGDEEDSLSEADDLEAFHQDIEEHHREACSSISQSEGMAADVVCDVLTQSPEHNISSDVLEKDVGSDEESLGSESSLLDRILEDDSRCSLQDSVGDEALDNLPGGDEGGEGNDAEVPAEVSKDGELDITSLLLSSPKALQSNSHPTKHTTAPSLPESTVPLRSGSPWCPELSQKQQISTLLKCKKPEKESCSDQKRPQSRTSSDKDPFKIYESDTEDSRPPTPMHVSSPASVKGRNIPSVPRPVLPQHQGICFAFLNKGFCGRHECLYSHKITWECESYLGLLVLHYVTIDYEEIAWKLLHAHLGRCDYFLPLAISLLLPLARHLAEHSHNNQRSNIRVPSSFTLALDIAKVRILCEGDQGAPAFKVLYSCFSSASPEGLQALLNIFVRFCESRPEQKLLSPWEKVLLWRYESRGSAAEAKLKDLFSTEWLRIQMLDEKPDAVWQVYRHLSQALTAPSTFFTGITCQVIRFSIDKERLQDSFKVLDEVRRLRANSSPIFTALIPPNRENVKAVAEKLQELSHLVCELCVPLPASCWILLLAHMMDIGDLSQTIDLVLMQINFMTPEVNTMRRLLQECIAKGPVLLKALCNLLCLLPSEVLRPLQFSLSCLMNVFSQASPAAQHMKSILIQHCLKVGIKLRPQTHASAYLRGRQSETCQSDSPIPMRESSCNISSNINDNNSSSNNNNNNNNNNYRLNYNDNYGTNNYSNNNNNNANNNKDNNNQPCYSSIGTSDIGSSSSSNSHQRREVQDPTPLLEFNDERSTCESPGPVENAATGGESIEADMTEQSDSPLPPSPKSLPPLDRADSVVSQCLKEIKTETQPSAKSVLYGEQAATKREHQHHNQEYGELTAAKREHHNQEYGELTATKREHQHHNQQYGEQATPKREHQHHNQEYGELTATKREHQHHNQQYGEQAAPKREHQHHNQQYGEQAAPKREHHNQQYGELTATKREHQHHNQQYGEQAAPKREHHNQQYGELTATKREHQHHNQQYGEQAAPKREHQHHNQQYGEQVATKREHHNQQYGELTATKREHQHHNQQYGEQVATKRKHQHHNQQYGEVTATKREHRNQQYDGVTAAKSEHHNQQYGEVTPTKREHHNQQYGEVTAAKSEHHNQQYGELTPTKREHQRHSQQKLVDKDSCHQPPSLASPSCSNTQNKPSRVRKLSLDRKKFVLSSESTDNSLNICPNTTKRDEYSPPLTKKVGKLSRSLSYQGSGTVQSGHPHDGCVRKAAYAESTCKDFKSINETLIPETDRQIPKTGQTDGQTRLEALENKRILDGSEKPPQFLIIKKRNNFRFPKTAPNQQSRSHASGLEDGSAMNSLPPLDESTALDLEINNDQSAPLKFPGVAEKVMKMFSNATPPSDSLQLSQQHGARNLRQQQTTSSEHLQHDYETDFTFDQYSDQWSDNPFTMQQTNWFQEEKVEPLDPSVQPSPTVSSSGCSSLFPDPYIHSSPASEQSSRASESCEVGGGGSGVGPSMVLLRCIAAMADPRVKQQKVSELAADLTDGNNIFSSGIKFHAMMKTCRRVVPCAEEREVLGALGVCLMLKCVQRNIVGEAELVILSLHEHRLPFFSNLVSWEEKYSEQQLAIMALRVLHQMANYSLFVSILEETPWSRRADDTRARMELLTEVLNMQLQPRNTQHNLWCIGRILASLVTYYPYDTMALHDYYSILDLPGHLEDIWSWVEVHGNVDEVEQFVVILSTAMRLNLPLSPSLTYNLLMNRGVVVGSMDMATAPERGFGPTAPERGFGPTAPERGFGPTAPERGFGPTAPERGFGPTAPERGFGPTAPERGFGPTAPENNWARNHGPGKWKAKTRGGGNRNRGFFRGVHPRGKHRGQTYPQW